MRFTDIDVNFDVRYEGHQNCPKILFMNILRVFSDHHLWRQNWHQYLWTSLCQFNFLWTSSIVKVFEFLTFDIFLTTWHFFDNLTSFWHFDTFNLNHLSPHRAIFNIYLPFLPSCSCTLRIHFDLHGAFTSCCVSTNKYFFSQQTWNTKEILVN